MCALSVRHPCDPVAKRWALRTLVKLGGYRQLSGYPQRVSPDAEVLQLVGAPDLETKPVTGPQLMTRLREAYRETEGRGAELDGVLAANLFQLGQLLGLNGVEQQILGFSLVLNSHRGLAITLETLGELTTADLVEALAGILGIRRSAVSAALRVEGLLNRSGLLRVGRAYPGQLKDKLVPLDGLVDALFEPLAEVETLLAGYFFRATPGTLQAADYPHIAEVYGLLVRYLGAVLRRHLVGVNILVYGPPGTGKSELARAVATELGAELYEVAVRDGEGDPLHRAVRWSAYQLSQCTLARSRQALVLFDDADDLWWEDHRTVLLGKAGFQKAWTNQLLEQNPVPTLWITNSLEPLDPAHIRRFALIIELGVPPRPIRRTIMGRQLKGLPVSEEWVQKLAEEPDVAPACVSLAAGVIRVVGYRTQAQVEQGLDLVLEGTLKALGHPRLRRHPVPVVPYQLDLIQADHELEPLIQGLSRQPEARICLYGPSGTGKTAWVHYLSERLDLPLLVRRASDILGPYQGETEQHLAQMFVQARDEGAMLLIDEADSFLRERTGAHHSWEVTQVNELLTQMEDFEGIFVCSTNLLEVLDSAVFRRFDLKIKLDYLTADQAWSLFQQVLGGAVDERWRCELRAYSTLTPGDFAAVVRRSRFFSEPLTAERLLHELDREVRLKTTGQSKPMGFLAPV